jgi:hypothetical protein
MSEIEMICFQLMLEIEMVQLLTNTVESCVVVSAEYVK